MLETATMKKQVNNASCLFTDTCDTSTWSYDDAAGAVPPISAGRYTPSQCSPQSGFSTAATPEKSEKDDEQCDAQQADHRQTAPPRLCTGREERRGGTAAEEVGRGVG